MSRFPLRQTAVGWGKQRSKDRYCAVCSFRLPVNARPIEITLTDRRGRFEALRPDREHPLVTEEEWVKAASYLFDAAALTMSVERGCTTCAALHRVFVKQHQSLFDAGRGQAGPGQHPSRLAFRWSTISGLPPQLVLGAYTEAAKELKYQWTYSFFTLDADYTRLLPKTGNRFPTVANLPSYDTASEQAFERLRLWLNKCEKEHEGCRERGEPGVRPLRILRIDDSGPGLRLVDGTDLQEPYACLSYRWGSVSQQTMLVKANEGQFRDGISEDQLPQLFRDARDTVRRLGLRYLWIDSLCIQQDEDDKEDWRTQSSLMASIYENARFTVAALVSKSSNDSLFRKQDPAPAHEPVTKTKDGRDVYMTNSLPHLWTISSSDLSNVYNEIQPEFVLLHRGWVFQERRMSRRVVFFAEHELMWECRSAKRCECRHCEGWIVAASKADLTNKSWQQVVMEFTKLDLTEPTDMLPALAGIARRLQNRCTPDGWMQPPITSMGWMLPYPWATRVQRFGISQQQVDSVRKLYQACQKTRVARRLVESVRYHVLVALASADHQWQNLSVHGPYLAGLWAGSILNDLMWYPSVGEAPSSPRLDKIKAPTWSWASVYSPISYRDYHNPYPDVTVQRWDIRFAGSSVSKEYGEVEFGSLTITAQVVSAKISYMAIPPVFDDSAATSMREGHPLRASYWYTLLVDGDTFNWNPDYAVHMPGVGYVPPGTPVRCLLLGNMFALILRLVDAEQGYYERIGIYLSYYPHDLDVVYRWSRKATVSETTIV